jgi:3D (Asp-Asp-Asp) domain-containing protein
MTLLSTLVAPVARPRAPISGETGAERVACGSITKGSQHLLRGSLLLVGALLFALLSTCFPSIGYAQAVLNPGQSATVVNTEGRGMRLRGGPGMTHRVVTTVPEGTVVNVIAGPVSDGGDDWYQVSAGTSTMGWGIGDYLAPGTVVRSMSLNENGTRTFLAKVTAYADGVGGVPLNARTTTGTRTRWGVVAVDPKVIPLGSTLLIEGYDDVIFVAEDVGGAIRGQTIDIWLPDANEARRYGTQYRKVTVLTEGLPR